MSYYYVKEAKLAWNMLNGIFNIYKPPGIHYENVKKTLILNLCKDLNELKTEPPCKHVSILGPTNKEMSVVVRNSYAEHPLVIGPSYIYDDVKMTAANFLSEESSGVLVFGVNNGINLVRRLQLSNFTRFYKLKGTLGQSRDNNFKTGKIVEKSTWKHIKREHVDRVCASMEASHQKKMFEHCGLDMQSQAAYELAVKGIIRSTDSQVPMVYSIKCIDLKPPEFTLEVVCLNESSEYLRLMIAEIGLRLKSTAYCNYIQCSKYGLFNVIDSLLSKQWHLQNILENMQKCQNILSNDLKLLKKYQSHLVQQPNLDKKQITQL